MTTTLSLNASALLAVIVALAYHISRRSSTRGLPLPPGPKPYPLLGNVLDMPLKQEWLTWQSYVEQYGDLVYLTALGRNFLLLGSHKAIVDLIEKRVGFNSRPRFPMFHELMDFDWSLASMPYGEHWRHGRKLLHAHLHPEAAMKYQTVQLRSARRFIRDLLASEESRPDDKLSDDAKAVLPQVIRANFALNAVRIIYGIEVRDPVADAHFVETPERVLKMGLEAGIPGRFLVDLFPFLKYIPTWAPGAEFHQFAAQTRAMNKKMRDDPFAVTQAQVVEETAPPSMVAGMLKAAPDQEQLIKDLAGTVYLAGSDTINSAVTSFFLAVLVRPEVQRLAQEELDRVVGRERLPEIADKGDLPFLEAVMRESLRWLHVLPLGVAHATIDDETYRGYFIPKGTIIFPFHWGLLHDPVRYPDPGTFSPERYLTRHTDGSWELRSDVTDPRTFAFGFGRRVCPGDRLADQSLFATLSTVLHTLNVTRAKDGEGKEVVPHAQMQSGLLCHPLSFPYEIRMRDDAQKLVDICIATAEQELL